MMSFHAAHAIFQNSCFVSILIGGLAVAVFPDSVVAQDGNAEIVVPPPRTITAALKPVPPQRIVDIHYLDADNRSCIDTFKLEAGRKIIHAGQSTNFRDSIQRSCDGKRLNAPVPVSITFSVRAANGKKNHSDQTNTIKPDGSSYVFSHTFTAAGTYYVTAVHRMGEVEAHTVSFTVNVLPQKVNAPAQENTN